MMRWPLGVVALLVVARPVCYGSNLDMDDEFEDWAKEQDEAEEFDDSVNEGFKNWEERCLTIGGKEVLDEYLEEQENLIKCFMDEFDYTTILFEMEEKKKKGELDEVFKKYCKEKVPPVRVCLKKFLEVSRECLHENERQGLNTTLKMVDAAINFTCHNSGDRIALFLAEKGYECMEKEKKPIVECVNNSVPELFHYETSPQNNVHLVVFDEQNCRKGDAMMKCVEESLLNCEDPTPSNLVHGMMQSVRDVTPCGTAAQGFHSKASHRWSLGVAAVTSLALAKVWL